MTAIQAKYTVDLMEPPGEKAIRAALEDLYVTKAEEVWPAAFDAGRDGEPIPLSEVEIVVLPLDRIGAPAGQSGAKVVIAYYAHVSANSLAQRLVSPPLVVKVGPPDKLQPEMQCKQRWPTLTRQVSERFAFPFYIFRYDTETSVLVAPFKSDFAPESDGSRNRVQVKDLWQLLEGKDELRPGGALQWGLIRQSVQSALSMVGHAHRQGRAAYQRANVEYASAYAWYLRGTIEVDGSHADREHIPRMIFGDADTVTAFGQTWPNPTKVIAKIVGARQTFEGVLGPVHGDLHPKNIVLDPEERVHIIDFGWAETNRHVIVDYLLLDANIRGTTLPSQISEDDILALAQFLRPGQEVADLPAAVRERGQIIHGVIWSTAQSLVKDWDAEYLTPLLLVGYGLLVHLDNARNQPALVAMVLAAAKAIAQPTP